MAQKKKSGNASGNTNQTTNRAVRQAKKEVKKAAKKHPKAFIAVVCVLLVIAIVAALGWYFLIYKKQQDPSARPGDQPSNPNKPVAGVGDVAEIQSADLSIHFIAPEVKASGDCTLIKVGDTEVLIDAGPTQGNVKAIKDYLAEYCTDGILEYVIVTHGDSDHISGMVGTSSGGNYNGILYSYSVGTLIQFDRTNQSLTTEKGNLTLYGRYSAAVEYAKSKGTKVFTASQCWYEREGAQKTYYLDPGINKISMNILYNYFYENESGDENNYSVCMLLSQELSEAESKHYLFTGDLELEGEKKLVENNRLPEVELYKAGHHGSKTSSNDCLLEVIKPKHVAVCCCAGYNQYGAAEENIFPTQAFISRIAKYTEQVYVTIMFDESNNGYKPMNGSIVFYFGKGEGEESKTLKLWCSDNTTVLKETAWFQENRVWGAA